MKTVITTSAALMLSLGLLTSTGSAQKTAAALAAVDQAVDLGLKIHGVLGSIQRKGVIHIVNLSAYQLSSPRTYAFSGNIMNLNAARSIPSNSGNVVGVRKSAQGYAGAVGVITYKIEGTRSRLAILYSIPYDYASYENWFKYAIIGEHVAVDKALYQDMYYNYGNLTTGRVAKARSGEASWRSGEFTMKGTMDTNGDCKMWVYLESRTKPQPAPRPLPGPQVDPGKSQTTGPRKAVRFTNALSSPVSVVWVDFNGKEQSFGTIAAGAKFSIESYPGHVWRFHVGGRRVCTRVLQGDRTDYRISP